MEIVVANGFDISCGCIERVECPSLFEGNLMDVLFEDGNPSISSEMLSFVNLLFFVVMIGFEFCIFEKGCIIDGELL